MPTVLVLPIGGFGQSTWTMDVDEAIQATELIDPELAIPCHYSVPFLWKRRFGIADDARFKREVAALAKTCRNLGTGEFATV